MILMATEIYCNDGHVKLQVSWRSSNRCKDTRRDVKSVVMGHYPGAFVMTAAEIVRTDVRFMSSQSVLLRVSVFGHTMTPIMRQTWSTCYAVISSQDVSTTRMQGDGHRAFLGRLSGRSGCDHLRRPHVQPINSHSELTNSLSHLRDTYIYTFIYRNDMCIYIYI